VRPARAGRAVSSGPAEYAGWPGSAGGGDAENNIDPYACGSQTVEFLAGAAAANEIATREISMTNDLVFYTHPMSRGRIVRWMLEEIGQPYRTELLEYGTTMKAPEYLAINPMGKVPAIRHGGVVVTEAAAICAYLADAFPAAGLAPPREDPQRGPYYRWLFFAAGPVEAAITNKALGVEIPAERERMAGYGTFAASLMGWRPRFHRETT
jgi:hypothetical protein